MEFTPIGTTSDWWFWSLKEFGGKLYAGTYEMQAPKIYNYPPWKHLVTFPGGESVLRLRVFKNKLYAASEDMGYNGHIYRMDSPTNWVSVHRETGWYPKPFEVFKGYLYSAWTNEASDVKILRSSNGTSWSQVKSWSGRGILSFVIYNNELYILGGWAAKTSDGINWSDVPVLYNVAPGWGTVLKGNLLVASGTRDVYKYDGNKVEKVLSAPNGQARICYTFNNQAYFLFEQGWKAKSGNTYLYRSPTGELGTWSLLKTFTDKQNGKCMAEFDSHLYLGIQNTVYKMSAPPLPPPPPTEEYIVVSGQKIIKPIKIIRAQTHLRGPYRDDCFGIWDNKLYRISGPTTLSALIAQGVEFDYPPYRYDKDVAQYDWTGISLYAGNFPEELLYKEEEVITTKTILHACGANIEYKFSSILEKNVALTCPYCNKPLGVKGIAGSAKIKDVSSIIEEIKKETLELDKKIAELEAAITGVRKEVDTIKKLLGL